MQNNSSLVYGDEVTHFNSFSVIKQKKVINSNNKSFIEKSSNNFFYDLLVLVSVVIGYGEQH